MPESNGIIMKPNDKSSDLNACVRAYRKSPAFDFLLNEN